MAMAVTADIDDPSAALYNPAGLSQGRHLEVRLGDTLIIPEFTANVAGGTRTTKANPAAPPHFYASYGITDQASVGIGFFVPFGLDITWPDGWQGRFLATHTSLSNYYVNPAVAYRFLDRIRVGVGLAIVRAKVYLRRDLNLVDTIAGSELSGSDWGVGFNAGLQVDVLPADSGYGRVSFGAAYRSGTSLDFSDGKVHFIDVPPNFQSQLKDQGVSTTVHLPQILTLGLSWRYHALRLGVDTEYTGWQVLRTIALSFQDPTLNFALVKRFHHTWNVHVGGEYAVTLHWIVRAGFLYDPTPYPKETISPDLPDADRLNFAVGGGFRQDGLAVDLGFQWVHLMTTTSTYPTLPGSYDGNAQVIGLTVGYKR